MQDSARGGSAKPRAMKLIATSSVSDAPGGTLMSWFFILPSMTACTFSTISSWCQLHPENDGLAMLEEVRLKNR